MAGEELTRAQELTAPPTVRELAMVLFRQRKSFVWAWALVLVAAVVYAVAGVKYQAEMKVLVRRGRADAPVSTGENAPLDLTRLTITEEELNSEVELLRDDEVLRRVALETGMGASDWLHFLRPGEGEAERVERAARRLAGKLKVESMKKTNLIAVSYAADDPRKAARVLQGLANAYLEKHMEVHRPRGQEKFFEQQTAESRRQLEESKRKLLAYAAQHGVVEAAEQRDLALQKLSEVDANYRQTGIDLAETQQRVADLENLMAKLPERTTTQIRTTDNPELQKSLKSSLLELRLKRTQLLTKFEPSHRLVKEVDQQIAQAESTIASENALPLRDETTDKSTQYEWAKSELQQAQVQVNALLARQTATRKQQAEYRGLTRQLGAAAITQDDLSNSEKAAQDNYLLYVKKQEEARMNDALDERGIVNVAIAEHPVAPALPIWSAWAVLAFGFVAAGAAGTAAAFSADYLDTGFRTPDDVVAYLNSPVLASLPQRARGKLSA